MDYSLIEDGIKFSLTLTLDGEKVKISCGNITRVEANLYSWGCDGKVEFWLADKHAKALLSKPLIIHSELSIAPSLAKTEDPEPLLVKGIVTTHSLIKETTFAGANELPIVMRLCSIDFKDFAQAVWSQHYPIALYTDKTMANVLEDQANPLITLALEFDKLEDVHPILAFGLGCEGNGASFYSFLMWYLRSTNGIWEYNHKEHTYTIRGERKEAGEPLEFQHGKAIASVSCTFPEANRASSRVFNGYTEDPKKLPIENALAYTAVNRDALLNTSLSAPFDQKVKEMTPLPTTFQHSLEMRFQLLPDSSFIPDTEVAFTNPSWSNDLFFKTKTYRTESFRLYAEAVQPLFMEDDVRPEQGYFFDARARLILKDETFISLPPYTPPKYPFFVEGKIFSELGDKEQLTHQGIRNDETSVEHYRVEIPLWENQKVIVPFEPEFSGQFYVPFNKGDRVLVALFFQQARIDRLLDWWRLARIPIDKQGNQIVFSPKKDENYTLIHYGPEEGDNTLLRIEKLSPKQLQTIHLKEDGIQIKIHEEGEETYKASIHMDVDSNMTLVTQNNAKDIVQVINLKEGEISSKCEANGKKSSYVQTSEQIQIDVETFILNSNKIFINSKETTHFTSDDVYLVESKGTVALKAEKSLSTEANDITSTAKAASSVNAADITLVGKSSLNGEATEVKMKAKAGAELGGSMVNIKGSLIKMN